MKDSFWKNIKMGANLSTFKSSTSARSASTCVSSSTGASIMELLKPGCLRSEKGVRKRPLTPEKKTTNVYSTSGNKKENISGESSFTSLGDWLTSSPGSKPDSMNGGELYVLRPHYSSSRRVHPSASSSKRPHTDDDEALSSKARDSFSINRSSTVKNEGDNNNPDASSDKMTSSLSRNQSGNKSNKRVRFRLPEEADIVIFYPSEEMFIDCEENFV